MDDSGKLVKRDELLAVEGRNSFKALLREQGDEIRRDVLMILRPEESHSGRLESGITIVYPGCRTNGHSHADREEVYFFLEGRGVMGVGDEEWEVKTGDTFYVHPGPFHTTSNPHETPLKFFWITIKID
ncbi:MAG: cupin domain-containing protein [Anaerolineales bacterium]|jgi:mannose-6-phosphate isomerase-like protein (cupin superfamily)